jgi:phosphoglycolate phosphatase-like HAD superfamily hydrolase
LASAKAALLDVDGTLVDSNGAHAAAWRRALAESGYDLPLERLHSWIGMGGDKILARIDGNLREDRGTGKVIARRRMEIFLDGVDRLQPTYGARELLERFERCGIRRIVATSAKRAELDAILKATRIDDCIDGAATSDDAGRSKPDADIVVAALRVAAIAPDAAVFVGDTPYDVEAAQRAGVRCVAVESGGWSRQDFAGALAVYADPHALARDFERSPFGFGGSIG